MKLSHVNIQELNQETDLILNNDLVLDQYGTNGQIKIKKGERIHFISFIDDQGNIFVDFLSSFIVEKSGQKFEQQYRQECILNIKELSVIDSKIQKQFVLDRELNFHSSKGDIFIKEGESVEILSVFTEDEEECCLIQYILSDGEKVRKIVFSNELKEIR